MNNAIDFKDKVVMDVGSGSGILSIFAAQAGAKKVWAIEASDMADFSRILIKHNKLDHIIEVVQAKIEDIDQSLIAERSVDVIVSEPLGTYLFNERMLETYVIARDKFLKPECRSMMFPCEADFMIMPMSDQDLYYEILNKAQFWQEQQDFYGLDLTCLAEDAVDEKFSQPILDCYNPEFK